MSAKPKICFITASELTVRWFLLDQLTALSRHYDVTLIVNTDNPEFLNDTGMSVRVLPVRIERQISIWRDSVALMHLLRIMWRERFVAVHSVTPKAGLLAMLAATICRVPVRIHTFTGQVWATRNGLARALLKLLDTATATMTTHLLIDSYSQRQFLIDEYVTSADKARVLGHGSISGVDIARFAANAQHRQAVRDRLQLRQDDVVFLYLGRLNRDKGLLDMAAAFVQAAQENWHWLIVGPDEADLMPEIMTLCQNCAARVHYLGRSHAPEVEMAAADVFCLPSHREGFGTVLIEAAAMGIPALASRIYGITDAVIDGETGLLHTPKSVDEIAEKMRLLATDTELRKRLGNHAMQRAQRDFSQAYVTGEVLAFYAQVMPNP
ncbi:MAG: glycosyltransferase family 4 protein [Sulfuriferula sp.]|nr:glycosyltransferase family 4 protein [Sulfuriferula sp.]